MTHFAKIQPKLKMCYSKASSQLLPPALPSLPLDQAEWLSPSLCLDLDQDNFANWLESMTTEPSPLPLFPTVTATDIPSLLKTETSSTVSTKRSSPDVDPILAEKRARNNQAAKRSREKRIKKIEELSVEVSVLEGKLAESEMDRKLLMAEKKAWVAREGELLARLNRLESCLMTKN